MGTSSALLTWREADYEPAAFIARLREILETAVKLTGAAAAKLPINLPELRPFAESIAVGDDALATLAGKLRISKLGAPCYFRAAVAVEDREHLFPEQLQGSGVEAIFIAFLELGNQWLGRLVILSRQPFDPTTAKTTLELLSVILLQALVAFQARRQAEREQSRRQDLAHRTGNVLGGAIHILEALHRNLPTEEAAAAGRLKEVIARLHSLGLASQFGVIRSDSKLKALATEAIQAALTMLGATEKVEPLIVGEEVWLTAGQAQALAAVLSELATNTVKHGGAGLKTIRVIWTITKDQIILDYADDGVGLPTNFTVKTVGSEHQGLGLITRFLAEIKGTFEILNPELSETGFHARIIFPYHPW